MKNLSKNIYNALIIKLLQNKYGNKNGSKIWRLQATYVIMQKETNLKKATRELHGASVA